MRLLGELMRRDPTPDEREAMEHVVEVAMAWQRGELALRAVVDLCSGYERWQAMRFADLGSDGKRSNSSPTKQIFSVKMCPKRFPRSLIQNCWRNSRSQTRA